MTGEPGFADLVGDALAAPFTGWDFSYLRGRAPADRKRLAARRSRSSPPR